MKRLIVTADDFGYSRERNKGIVESFLNGIVTTTSLMANAVHSEDAVIQAKQRGIPFKNIGLHLNITEGNPLSPKNEVASLLGEDGYFLGKDGFDHAVKIGLINRNEVKLEMTRQIERYKELTGQYPPYIDGHQHVHVTDIRESYSQILQKYGIQFTRQCTELDIEKIDHFSKDLLQFLILKSKEAEISKPVYKKHDIWSPDGFVGLSTMGSAMTIERLQSIISTAFTECGKGGDSVCELMVHPGYRTTGEGGCGNGPDEFSRSRDREHELDILTGSAIKHFLQENNIRLISYSDVSLVELGFLKMTS